MKARVKATGEIVEVYPSIHKGCDYDGSDGYSYVKEDIIILDDDPDYWSRLEHQYAGMVMHSILQTMPRVSDPDKYMKAAIDLSVKIATALVEKMKEERK